MKGLTKKQQEVLAYIEHFIHQNNYSPSYREIQTHFHFSSLSSVVSHLQALSKKGVLSLDKGGRRALLPLKQTNRKKEGETLLPLIGHLTFGLPIETFAVNQTIAVPTHLIHYPDQTYVLRIRGNGFEGERLLDGDLLIVVAKQEAQPGESIIGVVQERSTFIKKYYPEGSVVRLASHGQDQEPIILRADDFTIHGVLLTLLRIY